MTVRKQDPVMDVIRINQLRSTGRRLTERLMEMSTDEASIVVNFQYLCRELSQYLLKTKKAAAEFSCKGAFGVSSCDVVQSALVGVRDETMKLSFCADKCKHDVQISNMHGESHVFYCC
jgi:hypothetical protein